MPASKRKKEIHIVTVLGIPIRLDISWFLIFFLVAWTLALGYFPRDYPNRSLLVYWAMGIIAAFLLFLSVLVHELSHSFVARKFKIDIRGITLFIFGGVAEMEEEPHSPRSEFFIAIAGPAVSACLMVFFSFCAYVVYQVQWAALAYGVFRYLAFINGILIIFNMIPGFPLDGGRVLRAVLWHFTRSLRRATFISTRVGEIFGVSLIVFGILNFFMGNLIVGMWYAFIGLFLRNAAKSSYKQLLYRECFVGATVEMAMSHPVISVSPDCPLDELVSNHFLRYHYTSFPVARSGILQGYVTVDNLRVVPRQEWSTTQVSAIVNPNVDSCLAKRGLALEQAMRQIYGNKIHRLFVVDEQKYLDGVLTLNDVLAFLKVRIDLMERQK